MSQTSPARVLVLLLALLAAVLIGLWGLGALSPDGPPADGPVASGAPGTPGAAAPAPSGLAGGRAPGDPGGAPAAQPGEDEQRAALAAPGEAARATAPPVAIEGRVVLPDELPANEVLAVVAHPSPGPPGPDPEAFRTLADEPSPPASPEPEPEPEPDPWASAAVGPDGSFRLELPAGVRRAWLDVDGRYLYLPARVPADAGPRGDGEPGPVLRPELGAWIRGRAVAAGEGVGDLTGERVVLRPRSSRVNPLGGAPLAGGLERRGVVGEGGAFELRGVPASSPSILTGESERYVAGSVEADPVPGRVTDLDLAFHAGWGLRGRVVDADERPVAGAYVTAVNASALSMFGADPLREVSSGDDGSFELRGLPLERVQVKAYARGYAPGGPFTVEPAGPGELGELSLVLERGRSLEGQVSWPDGAPAADARLVVAPAADALTGLEHVTGYAGLRVERRADGRGRFTISGLGEGPFRLEARARRPGAKGGDEEGVAVSPAAEPGADALELVLAVPPVLRGTVRAGDGTPVPAFALRAEPQSDNPFYGPIFLQLRTETVESPDGSFALGGLQDGEWLLAVQAEGFAPLEPLRLKLPEAASAPLEVVLAPSAAVRGLVLAPEEQGGRGVPGARVRMLPEGGDLAVLGLSAADLPETTCDAAGRFVLEGLPAGEVRLVATAGGFADSEEVRAEVGGECVLQLRRGGRLTGEVFDGEGRAAVGVPVTAMRPGTTVAFSARTGPGGDFEMEHLVPGSWQVFATLSSDGLLAAGEGELADFSSMMSSMKFAMAEIEDGGETHVVIGAPPEDPVRVSGTVTAAGAPVSTFVSFLPESEGGEGGMGSMNFTQTGKDGTYSLVLDAPGRYLVSVQVLQGSTGRSNTIEFIERIPEEVEEHELDLVLPAGRISGRVYGPRGEPLPGARVTLSVGGPLSTGSFVGGRFTEAAADAEGSYEIPYLRPGTYTVGAGGALLGGAFGGSSAHGRQVRHGLTVKEGQWLKSVDFHLGEPGAIRGRVLDATGQPVSGAAVFVRDSQGQVLERFSFNQTDGTGRFEYQGVSAGEYTVSARSGQGASEESAAVRVDEGGAAEVTVSLGPGTVLLVRAVDGSGHDVEAHVLVTDEEGRQVNGLHAFEEVMTSLQQGFSLSEVRVGPLPPGRYTVEATTPEGHRKRKPVVLSGQPERKIKLRVQ